MNNMTHWFYLFVSGVLLLMLPLERFPFDLFGLLQWLANAAGWSLSLVCGFHFIHGSLRRFGSTPLYIQLLVVFVLFLLFEVFY